MTLNLHYLDARGALGEHRNWLGQRLREAHARANALLPLPPLDVVVKAGRHVIPEKGHVGHAPEPGVIYVTVDPASAHLRANQDASLERMFAHELHHAARWEGPGYGSSLGEALVAEGLAGVFAHEVFGGQPEPWERLTGSAILPYLERAATQWGLSDYGHNAWFFGYGDLPRWLGYSLGFQLVNAYLADHPDSSAASLADADAQTFRTTLQRVTP